jgi:hypothetical protein
MKTRLLFIAFAFMSIAGFSQMENAAFTETGRGASFAFVTDYQALGVNPANLAFGNRYDKKYTVGFAQFGLSFYSEAFTRDQLIDAIGNVDGNLTTSEKQQAGIDFANSDYSLDLYTNLFGFAVNTEKAGYFALSVNLRTSYYSTFNETGANQLFNGYIDPYFDQWEVQNPDGTTSIIPNGGANSDRLDDVILGIASNPQFASTLYSGTRLKAMAFTELNFGYGRNVYESEDISVNAGVGLKYLQGLFVTDINLQGGRVEEAFISATPALGIDVGDEQTNPSFKDGTGYTPVGDGFGFDLGINAEIGNQFRISASVTDIGSITYDGNVFSTADTVVFDIETQGIDSYNVFGNFDSFAGDDGVFQWEGQRERKVTLPTQFRAGLGYFHNEKLRLGLDFALPLNDEPGNIERMAFAFGAEFLPTKSVSLSAGIGAGDNFGFRVPFGLNFILGEGTWEMGVATRDLMYAFRDDRPNLSLVMGLLRFRFGDMETSTPSRMY